MGFSVKQFYEGKTIFLTGTTGFVGKVVLEKIIRSLSSFKKLFVMVRDKKGMTVQQRFEKEILAPEIFIPLFKADPLLLEKLRAKVVPVAGDLIIDKLGLSQVDRLMVTEECNLVINCAASVNFDDPLLDALEINYFGCMRMLELAKECKNIVTFTHVSTAYVNSNMPDKSKVEEKVYEYGNGDPEEIINSIVALGPQKVQEREQELLGTYPNTYTFSKSFAERVLQKRSKGLRVTILRPSIITACYDDPFEGWIDSPAAAGGIILGISMGIMHFVYGSVDAIIDCVPCDYVSNQILVQTAFTAQLESPQLRIVHASTSDSNPLRIPLIREQLLTYANYYPWFARIGKPWAYPVGNPTNFALSISLTETLPLALAKVFANVTNNQQMRKQVAFGQQISNKMFDMQSIFHHFINSTWHYQQEESMSVLTKMSQAEKDEFKIDVRNFKWEDAFFNNIYGLRRYYYREDVVPPQAQIQQILQKSRPDWFHDIRVANEATKTITYHSNRVYFKSVLDAQNFNEYVARWTKLGTQNTSQTDILARSRENRTFLHAENQTITFDLQAAQKQLEEMVSEQRLNAMRLLVWHWHKYLRRFAEGLWVEMKSVQMIKELISQNHKVIIMPMYKSFADFFVLMQVTHRFKIFPRYTFGNFEDTPRITVLDKWLKASGYIFSRRKQGQSLQSSYVNSQLLKEIITHNQVTTVFQNDYRSRAGKLYRKSQADKSCRWLLETFSELQQSGTNLMIVPLMISYDRIFESHNLATEMINGEKKDYTFWTTLKKLGETSKNSMGHIYVKYLDPLNLEQFMQSMCPEGKQSPQCDLAQAALQMTTVLRENQQKETPVTLNAVLSSWLLQERKPSIQMSELLRKSTAIYEYMREKPKLKTYMTHKPMMNITKTHIKGLGFNMNQVTKKDCKILLNLKEDDLRVKLMLAFYSMNLMPDFLLEGCLSIFLKNEVLTDDYTDGKLIEMAPLYDVIRFFSNLFRNEHLYNYKLERGNIMKRVSYFVKLGYLKIYEGDKVQIVNKDKMFELLDFFSNLIHPLIDTYMVTLTMIENICGKNLVLKNKKLVKELHVALKHLYQMKVIPDLHSCLKEIIQTALERFELMGFIQFKAYVTKSFSTTKFLQCPAESKPKVDAMANQIRQFKVFSREQMLAISSQIEDAILRVQGPLLIARL